MLVPLEIRERSPEMHPTVLPPTNERLPPAQGLPPACRLSAGKLHRQMLKAANVCITSSSRLFVMDRVSKRCYLVDTGSYVCVFPRKLLPGHREHTNYNLYAANGTTIATYGWTSQTLNLGLRRDFTWRFVVADIQTQSSAWIYYHSTDSSSIADTTACSMVSPHYSHQGPPQRHPSPV